MNRSANREDPRITRSRSLVLAAASDHFAERGYLGGNLDEIAARAGVSKKTVYNVFGDKEQLFRQVVWQAVLTAETYSTETAARLGAVDNVEPALREAVLRLARAVLTGPVIRLRRLLISEVDRFPEFAREYYERAPGLVISTLAGVLARLGSLGRLRIDDPAVAAEQLAFLVIGPSLDRALFAPSDAAPPALDLIESRANAGLDVFLSAHRTESAGSTAAGTG